ANGGQCAGTGVIVLTNALRKDVNEEIQGRLRSANLIGGEAVQIATLLPRNFSQAEASEVGSYKVGDIVVSPVASAHTPMAANVLYTVTGVSVDDKKLSLASPDREAVSLNLAYGSSEARKLAVFSEDKQDFYVGDAVKFKITDRENGIFNSAEGHIKSVQNDTFTVITKDGSELPIPTNSLAARGMQLAYASTAHDFQGTTVDRVLLAMSSAEQLTTQKSFYVSLSRMRDTIHLVTDHVDKLAAKIADQTGERMNALEALAAQQDAKRIDEQAPPEQRMPVDRSAPDQSSDNPINGHQLHPDQVIADVANRLKGQAAKDQLNADNGKPVSHPSDHPDKLISEISERLKAASNGDQKSHDFPPETNDQNGTKNDREMSEVDRVIRDVSDRLNKRSDKDQNRSEKDPKDQDQEDKSKDAQMSFADRLIASINQDQKQRDERSR
ncbi:hypothetical protein TW80_16305, partial [Loktanella sp. S4079]